MDATVFVRKPNTTEYRDLGRKKFSVLPRMDEFFSVEKGAKEYFHVIAVHHSAGEAGTVEIYAVQAEPPWIERKGRAIGFGN